MFVFFGHWLRWLSLHVRAALAEGFTFPFRWFARLLGLPFAPRPGDTCVSPTWLTRTLRSKGVIPPTVHVVTAIPESLSGNRGLVGVMTRVRVTYSQTVLDAPATFILKMSRPGRANRRTLMAGGQTRESRFYGSSLVWQLPHGLVPICYYAHSSSVLGESVMLLEDCVGVAPLNFVFGNQIWGIPKPLEPPRDQLDTLKAVFQSAADQHVAFWKSPDLLKMSWLRGASWYKGCGRDQWECAVTAGRRAWSFAKLKYGTDPGGDVHLSPKLAAIIDASYAVTSWERLQARLQDSSCPFTLCHNDFHASNMFLRVRANLSPVYSSGAVHTTPQDVVMFDWSEVGPWEGTTDLTQMIISDVRPDVYRGHTKMLVKAYWERLISKHNSPVTAENYPFEQCWDAFCRGGPERWIWLFSVISVFPGIPGSAVQYFHDQLLAFIEAHGDEACYPIMPVVCMW